MVSKHHFSIFPLKPKRIVWNHNRPIQQDDLYHGIRRRSKRAAQRGGFVFGGGRRPGFGFGHFGGHRGHHNGKTDICLFQCQSIKWHFDYICIRGGVWEEKFLVKLNFRRVGTQKFVQMAKERPFFLALKLFEVDSVVCCINLYFGLF